MSLRMMTMCSFECKMEVKRPWPVVEQASRRWTQQCCVWKGKHHRTLDATTTGGTKSPIDGTITTNAKLMSFGVDAL